MSHDAGWGLAVFVQLTFCVIGLLPGIGIGWMIWG